MNRATAEAPKDDKPLPFDINIGDTAIDSEQHSQLIALIKEYADVFCHTEDDLGYTSTITHKIPTYDEQPVRVPHRRIPPHQMSEVKAHLQKLLQQQIIRPSTSPYAAPIVIVRKKDNTIRLCVD